MTDDLRDKTVFIIDELGRNRMMNLGEFMDLGRAENCFCGHISCVCATV